MMNSNIFHLTLRQIEKNKAIIYTSIICFVLTILCYGKSFGNIVTPDDYVSNVEKLPASFFFQQGRFIQGIISSVFNLAHISLTASGFPCAILLLISLSACAAYFIYSLLTPNNYFLTLICASAIIVCNPIFSTMVVYHQSLIYYAICFTFLNIFLYSTQRYLQIETLTSFIISTFSLILVCGTYQPIACIAIIWCILYICIHHHTTSKFDAIRLLTPLIIGLCSYFIIYKLTKNIAGINAWDIRDGFLPLSLLPHRLSEIQNSLFIFLWEKPLIAPIELASIIFLSLFIFYFSNKTLSFTQYLLIFCMICISIIIIFLPNIIVNIWAPTPRSIVGLAFIYAIFFIFVGQKHFNKILNYSFASISIIIFILISNTFLYKVTNYGRHDQWITSYLTIDILKNYNGKQTITIVNDNQIHASDWSFKGLFYTYTGNIFNFIPVTQQNQNICQTSPHWPQAGYLHITNQNILMCL